MKRKPHEPETFELQFEMCRHFVTVRLQHSVPHVYCFLCSPALRNVPHFGFCPGCRSERRTPSEGRLAIR